MSCFAINCSKREAVNVWRGAYCGKMEEALAYRPETLKDCMK